MPLIDAYTPWQEPIETLRRRHVGRDEEHAALTRYLDAVKEEGRNPLPLWFCGPRGMGKSHLVALGRQLADERDLRAVLLPEDLPVARTAAQLLGTTTTGREAAWESWTARALEPPDVFLIEGLDRHLEAMNHAEQGELRRWFRETGTGLVATGIGVPTALTDREQPLYGAFDVWRLASLDVAESEQLLENVAGVSTEDDASKLSRRRALVQLAGGNPRALVALAQAAGADPIDVAEILAEVVRTHVPHYQLRFRDLSPDGQLAVSTMAAAPRGLRPKDLEGQITNPSMVLTRLLEDGIVVRQGEGRASWYLLAEPLFRFWLEYRQTAWEGTRAAALARLLGEVLTRRELAHVWWGTVGDLRDAIQDAHAESILMGLLDELGQDASAVGRIAALSLAPWQRAWAMYHVYRRRPPVLRASLPVDAPPAHRAVLRFVEALDSENRAPALRRLLKDLATANGGLAMKWLAELVVMALHRSEPRGRTLELKDSDRRHLLEVPVLRARFAIEGRLPHHPPFLQARDLAALDPPADAPDLADLLSAAHQLQLGDLFARLARHPGSRLQRCPRPDLRAPSRSGLAKLLGLAPPTTRWTWAASAALLDPGEWHLLLASAAPAVQPEIYAGVQPALLTALLALGTRSPERLADLESHDPALAATVSQVRRLLAQLAAVRDGPLQPELGVLWEAVRPRDAPGAPKAATDVGPALRGSSSLREP